MPRRQFIKKELLDRKYLLQISNKAIVNLSDYQLNYDKKVVLSRGISFCPQPTHVDKTEIHCDTLLFIRRLRLKQHFRNVENTEHDQFRLPTGWTPPVGKSPHLDTCINVTATEILEHKPLPTKCINITHTELEALTLVWWRYSDDIFMIWQHSREELCSF